MVQLLTNPDTQKRLVRNPRRPAPPQSCYSCLRSTSARRTQYAGNRTLASSCPPNLHNTSSNTSNPQPPYNYIPRAHTSLNQTLFPPPTNYCPTRCPPLPAKMSAVFSSLFPLPCLTGSPQSDSAHAGYSSPSASPHSAFAQSLAPVPPPPSPESLSVSVPATPSSQSGKC